jgi:neutral ceramidase
MVIRFLAFLIFSALSAPFAVNAQPLRVGAADAEFVADDSMEIGGGILAGKVKGQEGKLRAVAVVVERPGSPPVAIVACDVLMLNRDLLDPVAERIEKECGIPLANVLINCTHTHHAPSSCTIHGYKRDELFCRNVQQAIVAAVKKACDNKQPARFFFRLGEESSVGQNSRLLLKDDTIYWIGPKDDAVRPTGPFDPELPVLAFRGDDKKLRGLIFNHSTHTIGARQTGKRSPSFYGLAAQELETELGGPVCFLEGASGSTHNLSLLAPEMIKRIKTGVTDALAKTEEHPVERIAALKRKFTYKVRTFDEAKEDAAVSAYCKKRAGNGAESIIQVFRDQRSVLAPQQGQERTSWIQAMLIGDVAIVGVPAEFFTALGQEVKRRSPFRYTYVAELANDWIGYLPDRKAFDLGGYQTWTGLHSFAAPGTGEAVVDVAIDLLRELHTRR